MTRAEENISEEEIDELIQDLITKNRENQSQSEEETEKDPELEILLEKLQEHDISEAKYSIKEETEGDKVRISVETKLNKDDYQIVFVKKESESSAYALMSLKSPLLFGMRVYNELIKEIIPSTSDEFKEEFKEFKLGDSYIDALEKIIEIYKK
ncbi:hypothetical protein HQ533_05180 [Candidatus Woesearchaeota archaeon]|nr:hypothetical protein [Candidatus Woesearchaeota archaeon]